MTNEFAYWLSQNGLTPAFTTISGDALYINNNQRFAVIQKKGETNVQSFYYDEIGECKLYDDERIVAEWNGMGQWKNHEVANRFSTNEMYIKIHLKNQSVIRFQIFREKYGNIERNSSDHARLIAVSTQVLRYIYGCVFGK